MNSHNVDVSAILNDKQLAKFTLIVLTEYLVAVKNVSKVVKERESIKIKEEVGSGYDIRIKSLLEAEAYKYAIFNEFGELSDQMKIDRKDLLIDFQRIEMAALALFYGPGILDLKLTLRDRIIFDALVFSALGSINREFMDKAFKAKSTQEAETHLALQSAVRYVFHKIKKLELNGQTSYSITDEMRENICDMIYTTIRSTLTLQIEQLIQINKKLTKNLSLFDGSPADLDRVKLLEMKRDMIFAKAASAREAVIDLRNLLEEILVEEAKPNFVMQFFSQEDDRYNDMVEQINKCPESYHFIRMIALVYRELINHRVFNETTITEDDKLVEAFKSNAELKKALANLEVPKDQEFTADYHLLLLPDAIEGSVNDNNADPLELRFKNSYLKLQ